MSGNRIELDLIAKDLISGNLKRMTGGWVSSMAGAGKQSGQGFGEGFTRDANGKLRDSKGRFIAEGRDLGNALGSGIQSGANGFLSSVGASLLGNLGATAITGAIGIITSQISNAASAFTGKLQEAMSLEKQIIGAAGAITEPFNMSMDASIDYVKELRKELAGVASTLPGSTADYSAIAQANLDTIALITGGDAARSKAEAVDFASLAGVLASNAGVGGQEAGGYLERLIGGNMSFSEFRNINLGAANGKLLRELGAVASEMGTSTEDIQKLDLPTRYRLIKEAMSRTVTPEMVAKLSGTAEAQLEGLKTTLFDPDVGIFSFYREVQGMNGRSVLKAFQGALTSWLSLGSSISKLMTAAGVGFDPMKPIIGFLDWLTDIANSLSVFVNSNGDLDGVLRTIPDAIAAWVSGIDFTGIFVSILGSYYGLIQGMGEGLVGSLKGIDWGALSASVASGLLSLVNGIAPLMNRMIDWLGVTLAGIDFSAVGAGLVDWLWLAIGALGYLMVNIDWSSLIAVVFQAIKAVLMVLNGIGARIQEVILEGIQFWVDLFKQKIDEGFKTITDWVKSLIDTFLGWIQSLKNLIPAPLQGMIANSPIGLAAQAATGATSLITSALTGVKPGEADLGAMANQPLATQPLQAPSVATQGVAQAISYNPSVNVQAQTNADPQMIADVAVRAVDQHTTGLFRNLQQNQLTTARAN